MNYNNNYEKKETCPYGHWGDVDIDNFAMAGLAPVLGLFEAFVRVLTVIY